jgi:hypothetical protein
MFFFHVNLKSGIELANYRLIPITPEPHHSAKSHELKFLDQVSNTRETLQISPANPLTLLHKPLDEFTPEEPVLHPRMEVSIESITIKMIAPFIALLLKLGSALASVVYLGLIA